MIRLHRNMTTALIGALVATGTCPFAAAAWNSYVVQAGNLACPSLVVLPDNRPVIVFSDIGNYALKCAWGTDGKPNTWQVKTVDEDTGSQDGDPASRFSQCCLAVLPSGQPAVAYIRKPDAMGYGYAIRYAWYDGGAWHINTSYNASEPEYNAVAVSLVILPSGQPAISYIGRDPNLNRRVALIYAAFDGNTWSHQVVDTIYEVTTTEYRYNFSTSMKLQPSGRPAIAYTAIGGLRYAEFNGSTWKTIGVDSSPGEPWKLGWGLCLTFFSDGVPAISYSQEYGDYGGDDLKYAWRSNGAWYAANFNLNLNYEELSIPNTQLIIQSTGDPAISFIYNEKGEKSGLQYLRYTGSGWQGSIVDENVKGTHSLSRLVTGEPVAAYVVGYTQLKYAVKTGSDADLPDGDGDGRPDASDNCPSSANSDQANRDGDAAGDACDGCPDDTAKTQPGNCGCGQPETPNCGAGSTGGGGGGCGTGTGVPLLMAAGLFAVQRGRRRCR